MGDIFFEGGPIFGLYTYDLPATLKAPMSEPDS